MPQAAAARSVNALVNSNYRYRPSSDSALILATDPLGGALVAAAVELAGIQPAFAGSDEVPRSALRRVRPLAVLISADAACLTDAAFLGPAKMTGTRLFVFGREDQLSAVHHLIERYGLEVLLLPRDASDIGRRVRAATESSPRRQETTAP